ncbi:hypothetical protein L1887_38802 [Cichorium endivia]|nr:hypothetical protein L1887_38802 [Cichorium endivia]
MMVRLRTHVDDQLLTFQSEIVGRPNCGNDFFMPGQLSARLVAHRVAIELNTLNAFQFVISNRFEALIFDCSSSED